MKLFWTNDVNRGLIERDGDAVYLNIVHPTGAVFLDLTVSQRLAFEEIIEAVMRVCCD